MKTLQSLKTGDSWKSRENENFLKTSIFYNMIWWWKIRNFAIGRKFERYPFF